eukprot:g7046.t1
MDSRPGQRRKAKVAKDFDAFIHAHSVGRRGWDAATPDDIFDWLCFLDTHGQGTTVVHRLDCPGVGTSGATACSTDAVCPTRYAAESLRVSFVSKLKMAFRQELGRSAAWHPVDRTGNPCDSVLVESQSVSERISTTRDIALFSLAFYTMRRGFDLSCTLGSQVLQLPESAGMIYNFQFGKTLRKSVDSVVVLADRANHRICAFRGVRAYMSAASSLGWDLEQGHLFPEIGPNGERLAHPVKPAKMKENLVAHLGRANLPKHFSMHSFRVGGSVSESLAGTAVDEIMKLGGWRSERVAAEYIGTTTSDATKGKRRQLDAAYDAADKLPLSPAFKRAYGACRRR